MHCIKILDTITVCKEMIIKYMPKFFDATKKAAV